MLLKVWTQAVLPACHRFYPRRDDWGLNRARRQRKVPGKKILGGEKFRSLSWVVGTRDNNPKTAGLAAHQDEAGRGRLVQPEEKRWGTWQSWILWQTPQHMAIWQDWFSWQIRGRDREWKRKGLIFDRHISWKWNQRGRGPYVCYLIFLKHEKMRHLFNAWRRDNKTQ